MSNDNEKLLIYAGLVALGVFLLRKDASDDAENEANAPGNPAEQTCTSSVSDQTCDDIAKQLRTILDYYWVSPGDEQTIVTLFHKVLDECAYKKVYAAFGTITNMYGGFSRWDLISALKARVTEDTLNKIRKPYMSF